MDFELVVWRKESVVGFTSAGIFTTADGRGWTLMGFKSGVMSQEPGDRSQELSL